MLPVLVVGTYIGKYNLSSNTSNTKKDKQFLGVL